VDAEEEGEPACGDRGDESADENEPCFTNVDLLISSNAEKTERDE
jgi:hypothetical protein